MDATQALEAETKPTHCQGRKKDGTFCRGSAAVLVDGIWLCNAHGGRLRTTRVEPEGERTATEPRSSSEGGILVATDNGVVVGTDGVRYRFARGRTRFREGHPAVLAAPSLFRPIDVHYDLAQATAAPDEFRGA